MRFSAICLTFGRPEQLAEAVACFLAQDFTDAELIVYNTMPEQVIQLPHDRIVVFNAKERPNSLGEARNTAIIQARGDILVTWDDDDLYGPHHLRNFAKAFTAGIQWAWQPRQFYCEKGRIKGMVNGTMNVVAFTKAAFEAAGRYKEMNCGEDRDFVGRLTTQSRGVKIQDDGFAPSFFYAWGNGVHHISGRGDDKRGTISSWELAGREARDRLKRGVLQRGPISILPELKHDLAKMVRDFADQNKVTTAKRIAVILLGRYGDLCNFLPILRHIAENYARPHVIVNREFASLFEGVSYVEPVPVTIPVATLRPAIALATEKFAHFILAQVWCEDLTVTRDTPAYNFESWYQAGFGRRFSDATMFPVFDRRNVAREQALFSKLDDGRPMILAMLSGGVSSPFSGGDVIWGHLIESFGETYNLVNLANIRAERIYDLVGLIERAAAVVSIDTAIIHLCPATNKGYVALVNPQPWLGTMPRGNCVSRITYTKALMNPSLVVEAVRKAILLNCPLTV